MTKKILILQLARLGDIYQTWPILNALQRGGAEVHMLVRERYAEACLGLDPSIKVHKLFSKNILEPLFLEPNEAVEKSQARLAENLQPLIDESYDEIINLSFSPLSSYLSYLLDPEGNSTKGYGRFLDGSFAIKDWPSAYFFSQVGIGSYNRLHLVDLLAMISDVTLSDEDFSSRPSAEKEIDILLHIGASQPNKRLEPHFWSQVIQLLEAGRPSFKIGLIGSLGEKGIAEEVQVPLSFRVDNYVGQTSLPELMDLIGKSKLVVGADSAPMHMATLTGTPCLNLSMSSVNFWETGPRSQGSRVLWRSQATDYSPREVSEEALRMIDHLASEEAVVECVSAAAGYKILQWQQNEIEWDLIKIFYFDKKADPYSGYEKVFSSLREINQLALEQLHILSESPQQATAIKIYGQVEELLDSLGRLVPPMQVIVRWISVQKIAIGPAPVDVLVQSHKMIHEDLERYISDLCPSQPLQGVMHD